MENACFFKKLALNYKPTQYQNWVLYGRTIIIEGYN